MSTRPRRSSLKQKDASVDMLGLSRQEERMLQRAMYDSLRQQSQKGATKHYIMKSRENSITTRSKSLIKTSVAANSKRNVNNNNTVSPGSLSSVLKTPKIEQKVKRGTRYSPMRRLPLSEMLKSLEDRKNQLNPERSYSKFCHKIVNKNAKRYSPIVKKEMLPIKQLKLNNGEVVIRRPGRPRVIKIEPTESPPLSKEINISTRTLEKSSICKNKRIPRTASLIARSSWINQSSNPSSPTRSTIRISPVISDSNPTKPKVKPIKPKPEKLIQKPKRLIYNQKTMSHSQRISRAILANATERFKKARIKEKNVEKSQRLHGRIRSTKNCQDSKTKAVIPPELWLDPRGQPVDTEDFINFLIYRDTPYLDKSLKWFAVPPHKRKQRLYKIVAMEDAKFNETIVYNEKKEGGGREIVVHCQPPKLNDDGSELVSLDSDQVVVYTSLLDDNKIRCPASVNSSCVTQAAIDEDVTPIKLVNGDITDIADGIVEKQKPTKVKSPSKPDSKSIHSMEIRKRRT